jgi:hypothetical protein
MKNEPSTEEIQEPIIEKKYVAFCDILGFSAAVTKDIKATISLYREFINHALNASSNIDKAKITIYSDAILIVGDNLAPVLSTIQQLWFAALSHDYLIRGGVAFGDYWSEEKDGHFFVVSDALVQAVNLEASVSIPAVVLADDIEIPEMMWAHRFRNANNDGTFDTSEKGFRPIFLMPLLHFRDRNIVNPFNSYWFASAKNRVNQMLDAHPEHKIKYNWFLALGQAVDEDKALIPEWLFEKWVNEGMLVMPPKTK